MPVHALPYKQPDIETLLSQSSFLIALNITRHILDQLLFCGLVGQIFIGLAWGTPGASLLSTAFQETVVQLGYLGLVLIVFDGGLSTSLNALKSNFGLSLVVALTGVCLPIGLSFSLLAFLSCSPLQAFAAGSALCSTSLGTTFTILNTSGLLSTRLGVIVTSAAMLDDIVGLVMVQIISILGSSKASIGAAIVIRPIAISIAFASILPISCKFLANSLVKMLENPRLRRRKLSLVKFMKQRRIRFLLCTFFLLAFASAASFAGTSNLFAAYLAGVTITWCESNEQGLLPVRSSENSEYPHPTCGPSGHPQCETAIKAVVKAESQGASDVPDARELSNLDTTDRGARVNAAFHSLQPITGTESSRHEVISDLNETHQTPSETQNPSAEIRILPEEKKKVYFSSKDAYDETFAPLTNFVFMPFFFASIGFSIPIAQLFRPSVLWRGIVYAIPMALGKAFCGLWLVRLHHNSTNTADNSVKFYIRLLRKPKSLYPAALLGSAMIARGEIGFLVSAIAENNGIFTSSDSTDTSSGTSDVFFIITWAILICTILGPVAVGLLTRRVRSLQKSEREHLENEDPLGIWRAL